MRTDADLRNIEMTNPKILADNFRICHFRLFNRALDLSASVRVNLRLILFFPALS